MYICDNVFLSFFQELYWKFSIYKNVPGSITNSVLFFLFLVCLFSKTIQTLLVFFVNTQLLNLKKMTSDLIVTNPMSFVIFSLSVSSP